MNRPHDLDEYISPEEARTALVGIIADAEAKNTEYGYLGRLNADQTEYDFFVANEPGYVHCMIERANGLEYAKCIPRVSLNPYIRCMFKKIDGVLEAEKFVGRDAVRVLGDLAPISGVPGPPLPGFGGVYPPPVFNDPEIKIIGADDKISVATDVTAGADAMQRFLILQPASGSADNLIEIEGLRVGDVVVITPDTSSDITIKHDDAGATDKILLYNEAELVLSYPQCLILFKRATGQVVQFVDENGSGGGGDIGGKTRLTATEIYDLTLGSNGAFDTATADDEGRSGIPSGFDWLEVVLDDLRSTASVVDDAMRLWLNNDTTAGNYRRQALQAANGAGSFGAGDDSFLASLPGASGRADSYGSIILRIPTPDSTTSEKKVHVTAWSRSNTSAQVVDFYGIFWENTAAITRIMIRTDNHATDLLLAGARMRVYGWKTETIGGLTTSSANVSNPPTDAELDSAFGTPAAVGNGFAATINDDGADTAQWLAVSNGTSWYTVAMTKAL